MEFSRLEKPFKTLNPRIPSTSKPTADPCPQIPLEIPPGWGFHSRSFSGAGVYTSSWIRAVTFPRHSQGLGGNSGWGVVGDLFHVLDIPIFLLAHSWSYGIRTWDRRSSWDLRKCRSWWQPDSWNSTGPGLVHQSFLRFHFQTLPSADPWLDSMDSQRWERSWEQMGTIPFFPSQLHRNSQLSSTRIPNPPYPPPSSIFSHNHTPNT